MPAIHRHVTLGYGHPGLGIVLTQLERLAASDLHGAPGDVLIGGAAGARPRPGEGRLRRSHELRHYLNRRAFKISSPAIPLLPPVGDFVLLPLIGFGGFTPGFPNFCFPIGLRSPSYASVRPWQSHRAYA